MKFAVDELLSPHHQQDLLRAGLNLDAVQLLMDGIEASVTIVNPFTRRQIVARDPDDDALVDCAVESGSSCIVSGDAYVTEMREIHGITVLTPRQFVDRLKLG